MAQRRILEQARPTVTEIDRLIFQMETTLGKAHTVSPFTALYQKYNMSQNNAAEEKKGGASAAASAPAKA